MKGNQMSGGNFFALVASEALINSTAVLQRILPGGALKGREYVVLNPRRSDGKPGSFKINIDTGRWADFATGDGGGDLVSLVAYVFAVRQTRAATLLAEMLGVRR